MARQKQPKQVAEVKSEKTGTVIAVFLDPTTLKFSATFEGDKFEADTAQEVKDWAKNKANADRNIAWEQMIQVNINDMSRPRSEYGYIAFSVRRFWVGRTPSGKLLQSEWDVTEQAGNFAFRSQEEIDAENALTMDERLLRGSRIWDVHFLPAEPAKTFIPPVFVDRDRQYGTEPPKVFLPYSAHLWASLMQLGSGINKLAGKIDWAFRQPNTAEILEGLSTLVAFGVAADEAPLFNQRAELLRIYDLLMPYVEAEKRAEVKEDHAYDDEDMDQIGIVVELGLRSSGSGNVAVIVYDPDMDPHTPPVDTVANWFSYEEGIKVMGEMLTAYAEKEPGSPI
jgi:hypothetical protein